MFGNYECKTTRTSRIANQNYLDNALGSDEKLIRKVGSIDLQSEGEKLLLKVQFENMVRGELAEKEKFFQNDGSTSGSSNVIQVSASAKRINLSAKRLHRRVQSLVGPEQLKQGYFSKMEIGVLSTERDIIEHFDNYAYCYKSHLPRESPVHSHELMQDIEFKPSPARKLQEEDKLNGSRLSDIFKQENFMTEHRRPSVIRDTESDMTKDSIFIELLQKNNHPILNEKPRYPQNAFELPLKSRDIIMERTKIVPTDSSTSKKMVGTGCSSSIPRLNLESLRDRKSLDKETKRLSHVVLADYKVKSKGPITITRRETASITERAKSSKNTPRLTNSPFGRQPSPLILTERLTNPFKTDTRTMAKQKPPEIERNQHHYAREHSAPQDPKLYPTSTTKPLYSQGGIYRFSKKHKAAQSATKRSVVVTNEPSQNNEPGQNDGPRQNDEPRQNERNSDDRYITLKLDELRNKIEDYFENSKELEFRIPCSDSNSLLGNKVKLCNKSREHSENLGSAVLELSLEKDANDDQFKMPATVIKENNLKTAGFVLSQFAVIEKETNNQRGSFPNMFINNHKSKGRTAQLQQIELSKESFGTESQVSIAIEGNPACEQDCASRINEGLLPLRRIDMNSQLHVNQTRCLPESKPNILSNKDRGCPQMWKDISTESVNCNVDSQAQRPHNFNECKMQNLNLLGVINHTEDQKKYSLDKASNSHKEKKNHTERIPLPTFSDPECFKRNLTQEPLQTGMLSLLS